MSCVVLHTLCLPLPANWMWLWEPYIEDEATSNHLDHWELPYHPLTDLYAGEKLTFTFAGETYIFMQDAWGGMVVLLRIALTLYLYVVCFHQLDCEHCEGRSNVWLVCCCASSPNPMPGTWETFDKYPVRKWADARAISPLGYLNHSWPSG